MIVAQRTTSLSYGTDSVAQSVRSAIAAPAVRIESHPEYAPGEAAPLDLTSLYPSLFAPVRRPFITRTARAVAFRFSVLGAAAAVTLILHHVS